VMTTSTPTKLSFSDIVKGSSTPTPPAALKPGKQGEKRCFCQGEVLMMLGHYGWIMTFDDIDHPDTGMTGGRVYVHKRNVERGVSLAQGDVVSFYLYADEQGLGAECCQLEQRPSQGLCADAAEFVPGCSIPPASWNVCAAEFVPASAAGLSMQVAEFVPKSTTVSNCLSMEAAEFVPSNFLDVAPVPSATKHSSMVFSNPIIHAINLAFFSDDESDDESSIVSNDDISGNIADKEGNGVDDESDSGEEGSSCDENLHSFQQAKLFSTKSAAFVPRQLFSKKSKEFVPSWRKAQDRDFESSPKLDMVGKRTPLKLAQVASDEDSTSVGSQSDSEEEPMVHCALRAPPGLSLPASWRAPPGLSLPALAA